VQRFLSYQQCTCGRWARISVERIQQSTSENGVMVELGFFPSSTKTIWWTLVHLQKRPWPLTCDLEIQYYFFEVVAVHVHTKYHEADMSAAVHELSCPHVSFFALSRNGDKVRKSGPVTLTFDLQPWNLIAFARLSIYMFVQNFIELSVAVRELSCVQTTEK